MTYHFIPKGVCSRSIDLKLDGDIIRDVRFEGGCNGNLKGISALVIGQRAEDVVDKLENIQCGHKGTSCPAQLAQALMEALQQQMAVRP